MEDSDIFDNISRPGNSLPRRWGQAISCISWLPALAPALAAKIGAAYRRYFSKGFHCRWLGQALAKVFFSKEFCCRWLGCGAGVGNKLFGAKLLSKSIAGRIVLSYIHVSMRRTWNIQKLICSGLARGRIITLE